MKKIFIAGLTILTLSGCVNNVTPTVNPPSQNETANTQQPVQNPQPAPQPVTPPAAQNPKTQTYRNVAYKFEFDYPAEYGFTAVNYANLEEKIIQVAIPSDAFPKTNFGDAGFAVSVGNATTEKECLNIDLPEGSDGFKKTTTVNGTEFYTSTGTGAGAGNIYDSKIYRTFIGKQCFEIDETVHTSNIGNYDPGTVKEVDKDKVWAILDGILATFKFTA